MRLAISVLAALLPITAAAATLSLPQVTVSGGSPPNTGSTPFTPLHVYFMSPTGNDGNSGADAAHAWATPNHPVKCGDVIRAASGSYGAFSGTWGAVSGCPSTTGGIDGKGGVWFAVVLCDGAHVGDCYITDKAAAAASGDAVFRITQNNWAVEGWYVNTNGRGRAFEAYSCTYSGGMKHHVAIINSISANNLQAYDSNDCGQNTGSTAVPSPVGADYSAVVGVIAQNSAADPYCVAAIDIVGPGVFDTKPGTHNFVFTNYAMNQVGLACRTKSDIENYMYDTPDAHNAVGTTVFANNIGWSADRVCIQVFEQNYGKPTSTVTITNNTCFRDNLNTNGNWINGEINVQVGAPPMSITVNIKDNIALQPLTASLSGGGGVAAYIVGGGDIPKLTNTGNVLKAVNTSCRGNICNPTFDAQTWGPAATLGTNQIYADPQFTNTGDLLSNRSGVPDCSAFENTTQCMGWDAGQGVLTKPSVISDLTPKLASAADKGFQQPSVVCAPNADYPDWLKGIVYLHVEGANIVERAGLVTKPCGM